MKRAIKHTGSRKIPGRWQGQSGVVIQNERASGFLVRPGGWLRRFCSGNVSHIAISPYIRFRKGESARTIARDYKVPVGVIEDIVRFYLLHPEAAKQDGWV